MWTRRQFGLWTSASLLLPSAAIAGPTGSPRQQAVRPPKPSTGLDAVVLTAAWKSADEYRITYTLSAFQPGPEGLELRYDLQSTRLDTGGPDPRADDPMHAMAWLNGNFPYSRRVMAPDFIDLPANRTLAIGELHLNLEAAERDAKTVLHASITLWHGERSRVIALAPLSVRKPTKRG